MNENVSEENKNLFDSLATTENVTDAVPEDDLVQPTEDVQSDETELNIDSFAQYTYLRNPEVGNSVEFTIEKIVKKKGAQRKNSADGTEFWTGLKGKNQTDEDRVETIFESVDNERFSVNSWGLYFKLFGKNSELIKKAKENKGFKGIKLRITHVYNGKDSKTKIGDLMKLRGFATEEEAIKHRDKVAEAIKSGDIYKVEIL